jgi:hypothetical protein
LADDAFLVKRSRLADLIPRCVAPHIGKTPIVIAGRGPSAYKQLYRDGEPLPSFAVNVQYPYNMQRAQREGTSFIKPAGGAGLFPPNVQWCGGIDDHYWYRVWPLLPDVYREGKQWLCPERVMFRPWPGYDFTGAEIQRAQLDMQRFRVVPVTMPKRPIKDVLPVGSSKWSSDWYGEHRQWGGIDVMCARAPHVLRLGSSSVVCALTAMGLTDGPIILAGCELSEPKYEKQVVWFENLARVCREEKRPLFLSPYMTGRVKSLNVIPLWQG